MEERNTDLKQVLKMMQRKAGVIQNIGEDGNGFLLTLRTDHTFECRLAGSDYDGMTVRELIRRVSDRILRCSIAGKDIPYDPSSLSYEELRDRLIVRPLNMQDNPRFRGGIFRTAGDIALVLYCEVTAGCGTYLTAMIPQEMAASWNMSGSELLEEALVRTEAKYPACLFTEIEEFLHPELSGTPVTDDLTPLAWPLAIPALTCRNNNVNGACALFYPGVQKKLTRLMGGNYYVVFTGVSEARLHRADLFDLPVLADSLHACNEQFPDTLLSRHVFLYDEKTDTLSVCPDSYS